uniref:Ty3 transposon capsid-like protein domain-containing protein n=1 Tax=Ananas comosus var. bracteatus TaxID=296719 RepID=A0A6V7NJQ1_ANACO|nr:unnamed protein product [Ananas comosus var. bracteatus]
MHMEPKVDTWFHGYIAEKGVVNWEVFAQDVCRRFDSNGLQDVVEEFNKLTQQGTVEEYQERFEYLRSRLLQTASHFAPDYFLSSFLSGLKDELKSAVKMMYPKSLIQAFELARWQEQNIAAMMRRNKVWFKTQGVANLSDNSKGNSSATTTKGVDTTRNYTSKTAAERVLPVEGTASEHEKEIYNKWIKEDRTARYTMLSAMQDDLIGQFEIFETAKDMWDNLKITFGQTSSTRLRA